ncbi:MAG: circularly permuted type 2 ATP-grasp protein, partial [Desulfurococcales archaeon]|nr:circularly permuted type 2 ATP-grasp protein [Desulfurococcales archaeon]
VPGLSKAYADGKVALVNAWGTGVADDKLVYHYIPQVIREYLGEDPIIPQPKTYAPIEPGDLLEIRKRIHELVVKTREGYGGFGTIVIPDYKGEVRDKIARDVLNMITLEPDHYIAQELVKFSTSLLHSDSAPLLLRDAPIDFRVYVYYTAEGPQVPPGGLSRYARHGMITNNSSGGGIKETWVIV